MDVFHILLGRPWWFDHDITDGGRDNMMMFTWGILKIVVAPILNFNKNPEGKKSSFLVMMLSENELDDVVKEIGFFLPNGDESDDECY